MSRLCRLKTASHGDDGQWAYDEIFSLRKQRDELLAALENTHNALKHFWPEGHVDAIAAIARVKGEQ